MAITVKETSRELTKKEIYAMTKSPEMVTLKNVDDNTLIEVDAYLRFADVKESTGEVVDLLSILDKDGTVYCCQSDTFKREFEDICDIMEGEPFSIKKLSGTTKSGRGFITCSLV